MNLFNGRASAPGGFLTLSGTGWTIAANGTGAVTLVARLISADDAVTVSIRPEDLDLTCPGPTLGTGPCMTAEPLGSKTLYNVDIDGALTRVLRRELRYLCLTA